VAGRGHWPRIRMASFGDGRRMSTSLLLAPLGLGIEGGRQNEVRMGLPRRVHGMATDICGTQSSPGVERDDKTSSASGDRFWVFVNDDAP
jgi:hypothetical protein